MTFSSDISDDEGSDDECVSMERTGHIKKPSVQKPTNRQKRALASDEDDSFSFRGRSNKRRP